MYNKIEYNNTKKQIMGLVRKNPVSTRTSKTQSQINKLGTKLNKMDDWHYKKYGYWFGEKPPKKFKILVFR